MSAQGDGETSSSVHDDQVAPPAGTLDPVLYRYFKSAILPRRLIGEASRYLNLAMLRNNPAASDINQEAFSSLKNEIGTRRANTTSFNVEKVPLLWLIKLVQHLNGCTYMIWDWFFGITLRNELQGTCSTRSLTCPAALSNLRFSLVSAIIVLHRAFKGQWNWLLIQGFDPLYTEELASDEETTSFLADVNIIAGHLAAAGDVVHRQLKDMLNLTM
ncbi:hypothetical protein DFH29DRAFT_877817 [Suillus ampliporus]|nr:hypothetical protein DFH29DRAFT_877817 [Suillus ampliporus]